MDEEKNQNQDPPSREGETAPKPRKSHRRLWIIGGLAGLFLAVGIIYGIYWLTTARFYVGTDDSYVDGNMISISPQVSGIVAAVDADNTDLVEQGQVLVTLDQSDAKVALAQAEAQLGQAVRQVRQLYQQEAEQEAAVAESQANLDLAKQDFNRDQQLYQHNTIAIQQLQHTQTTLETAKDAYRRALKSLLSVKTQTDFTDLRHQPDVMLAASNLRKAFLNLQRTTVVAPVRGYVAQRTVQVGQEVSAGTALLAIVPPDQMWIQANFKETQLGSVRIGQPARVTSDFYGGGVVYNGRVVGILSGTGDVFQLLPPQNATGNWIKIVRRVPVRISLNQEQLRAHPLRLGLSVEATIDIHTVTGEVLAATPPAKPLYQTDVYGLQGKNADELVERVIRQNGGDEKPGVSAASPSPPPLDHGSSPAP